MDTVLEMNRLTRRYGDRVVLKDVSLVVAAGEIHALLGPNGAGKTTALECAEGLRQPDEGQVLFLGERVRLGQAPRGMGIQLQASSLPGAMTVREILGLVAAYRQAPVDTAVAERLQLGVLMDQAYRALSVGQQRRVQLGLALAHAPKLVVLDEPTAGLDVATRVELHALMGELKKEGTAIILATHDMAEAEKLSDRVTVLMNGRVVARGTPRELTRQGERRTRIEARSTGGTLETLAALPGAVAQRAVYGSTVWLSEDAAVSLRALLDALEAAGDTLVDLRVERPSLEERFLELTRAEAV